MAQPETRPPELNDRLWLLRRYARVGEVEIAKELGCSRKAVRTARDRFGIPRRPRGHQAKNSHFETNAWMLEQYWQDENNNERVPPSFAEIGRLALKALILKRGPDRDATIDAYGNLFVALTRAIDAALEGEEIPTSSDDEKVARVFERLNAPEYFG